MSARAVGGSSQTPLSAAQLVHLWCLLIVIAPCPRFDGCHCICCPGWFPLKFTEAVATATARADHTLLELGGSGIYQELLAFGEVAKRQSETPTSAASNTAPYEPVYALAVSSVYAESKAARREELYAELGAARREELYSTLEVAQGSVQQRDAQGTLTLATDPAMHTQVRLLDLRQAKCVCLGLHRVTHPCVRPSPCDFLPTENQVMSMLMKFSTSRFELHVDAHMGAMSQHARPPGWST